MPPSSSRFPPPARTLRDAHTARLLRPARRRAGPGSPRGLRGGRERALEVYGREIADPSFKAERGDQAAVSCGWRSGSESRRALAPIYGARLCVGRDGLGLAHENYSVSRAVGRRVDRGLGRGAQARAPLAHGRRRPVAHRRHRRHRAAEHRLRRDRHLRRLAADLRRCAPDRRRVLDPRRHADGAARAAGRADVRRGPLSPRGAPRRHLHADRRAGDVVRRGRGRAHRDRHRRPRRRRAVDDGPQRRALARARPADRPAAPGVGGLGDRPDRRHRLIFTGALLIGLVRALRVRAR